MLSWSVGAYDLIHFKALFKIYVKYPIPSLYYASYDDQYRQTPIILGHIKNTGTTHIHTERDAHRQIQRDTGTGNTD